MSVSSATILTQNSADILRKRKTEIHRRGEMEKKSPSCCFQKYIYTFEKSLVSFTSQRVYDSTTLQLSELKFETARDAKIERVKKKILNDLRL